ncbi:MAG: phospholipid carrier-dependent glycosyltransferase, partial [Chloroflexota bacterium]
MNIAETPPTGGSRFLWVLVLLFLILGLGYSTLTPVFEHSDETLHYPYVKHLADGRGLPLAVPGQLWNQEGTQPPLYYALVAAATFWIDTNNLPELLQRNPHWLFTEVRALLNDNQNLVLHGPPDSFPYRRAALAVQLGRGWSLVFGVITVICTYFIARRLFPSAPALVVLATALTALNPQFIRVSATVSNDSLAAALTSLAVLLALKFTEPTPRRIGEFTRLPPSRFRWTQNDRQALLLGIVGGLALLAKLSSLSTLVLVVFIVFWRLFLLGEVHQSPFQHLLRWLVIMGLAAAVLTGWWFARNFLLYGEWLAAETHLNLAGRSPLSAAQAWDLRAEAERAYWATFGWGQIRPPEGVYRLLFWLTRLGLIGLGLGLMGKLIQGSKTGPLPLNLKLINFEHIFILLLWAGLNLVLYLRWVMEVGSVSHTRLVFPAITAISVLLAVGWHTLLPRRLAPAFSGLAALGLLALNIYSLGWLLYPAFRPTSIESEASAHPAALLPTAVNLTFLDSLKLVDTQVYPQNKPAPAAKPDLKASAGDVILVEAAWQVLAPLDKNYSLAIVLLAPDGSVLAHRETYPGLGLRPTRYLQPGRQFQDVYPLKLETDVPAPIVARLAINLFDFESESRAGFPAIDAGGHEVTPSVGQLKLVPLAWPEYHPTHVARVIFGQAIALTGYDFTAGGKLTLYWESLAQVDEDYIV